MRAHEESGEGAKQLIDATIDGIDRFVRDESATDAALVAHDGQRQAGGAQTVEQRARIRAARRAADRR